MLNVLPYTGCENLDDTSSQYKELPQPAQVVPHLAEPYLDQGQQMFTDRYYTSIPLAEALHGLASSPGHFPPKSGLVLTVCACVQYYITFSVKGTVNLPTWNRMWKIILTKNTDRSSGTVMK